MNKLKLAESTAIASLKSELNPKYLKPRVIYLQPNDYTDDVLPKKRIILREQRKQE